MVDFKTVSAAFIVLTVVFGAATGYLLVSPSGGSAATSTAFTTSTLTTTASATGGSPGYTVNIAYKAAIGFYLVDGSGMTLYFRTNDIRSNGTSTCTGTCVQIWPVFYSSNLVLPPGLSSSSFTVVMRADGKQQIDYNGSPLYYYASDGTPGDVLGQGIGGIWFAYTLPTPSQLASTSSSTTSTSTTGTGYYSPY
jgi:predicted lipoprotein with Yx(FWY)xxD motif